MKPIRNILVATDFSPASRPAFRRALELALANSSALWIAHVAAPPGPLSPDGYVLPRIYEEMEMAIRSDAQKRLRVLLARARRLGVRARALLLKGAPHEAIVRRALASRAGLVVAATRRHVPGARLVLRNTDWELIRHCPVPLLLVKTRRAYVKPAVIAAVDPFHARPADLDARLLTSGGRFAQLLHGKLHVFHSYMPLVNVATLSMGAAPLVTLPPQTPGRA